MDYAIKVLIPYNSTPRCTKVHHFKTDNAALILATLAARSKRFMVSFKQGLIIVNGSSV